MSMKLYSENDINSIAEAINTKGVIGSFTVSEMADAVLEISGGGGVEPVTTIVLSSNKVKTTGDVTLTVTLSTYRDYDVLEENGYLEGATVTFYKMLGATPNPATDTSLSTSITNNMGECSIDTTISETSNLYARFSGITGIHTATSNVVTVEVINYLFYDACNVDNTNQYNLVSTRTSSVTGSLTFDSTNSCYILKNTNEGQFLCSIPDLTGVKEYKLTYELLNNSNHSSSAANCGVMGWGIQTTYNNFDTIYIEEYGGNVIHYNGGASNPLFSISSPNDKWLIIEVIVETNKFSFRIYDKETGNLLGSIDNYSTKFSIDSSTIQGLSKLWSINSLSRIREIKVTSL